MGHTPSQAAAAHTFVGRTETSLGFIGHAQTGPLSAKADGKPPALSPVSDKLRARKRSKPTSCRATYLCCDGPTFHETEANFAAIVVWRISGLSNVSISRATEQFPGMKENDDIGYEDGDVSHSFW